jgi:predicted nuclease of predicted toxin-antitoxin system
VFDIGPADALDRDIWRYSPDQNAVLVTKDEDFADMVDTGREAPPAASIGTGNTRRAALLAWFEPLVDQVVTMVRSGDRVVELR